MLIETQSSDFFRVLSTDSTDSSFPSVIPTTTEPTGVGVIELGFSGGQSKAYAPNGLVIVPYGTGADDATITGMRVIGWSRLPGDQATTQSLWIPFILLECAAILSTAVGVAGSVLTSTYRFCDTITLVGTSGNANISHELISPTGNVIASVTCDTKGCQKVQVTFDLGTATAANAIARRI